VELDEKKEEIQIGRGGAPVEAKEKLKGEL
jgi:hypothetical protein